MKAIKIEDIQLIETEMIREILEICQRENIDCFLLDGSTLGAIRHQGPIPWDSDADVGISVDDIDRFCECACKQLSERFYVSYCTLDKRNVSTHPEIFARGVDGRVVHVDICPMVGMPDDQEEAVEHLGRMIRCIQNIHYKRFSYIGIHGDHSLRITVKRGIHYFKCLIKSIKLKKSTELIEELYALRLKYPYESSNLITTPEGGTLPKHIVKKEWFKKGVLKPYSDLEVPIPADYDEYLTQIYGDYMTPPDISERENQASITAKINPQEFKKYFGDLIS